MAGETEKWLVITGHQHLFAAMGVVSLDSSFAFKILSIKIKITAVPYLTKKSYVFR